MFTKLRPVQFLLTNTLARNTGWMLLGQGLKLIIQALYFTMIARSLGASRYGAFVGVVALVGIFSPFASLGSGYLLIKNVARDPYQFSSNWGRALSTTLLSSSILFAVIALLSRFVLPLTIPFRTSFKSFKNAYACVFYPSFRCINYMGVSRWNEWITLPIRYCDLPLSSQITFTVWDIGGPRTAVPVGGSTFRLFGKKW